MAASKAFGRDKKGSTFALFLTFILVYIILGIIVAVLSLGGGGRVIQTLLTIPAAAWTSVVINYTYITHGPSASAPVSPVSGMAQPPLGTGTPTGVQPSRFCANCGSPVKADSRFCANCGKPI